MKYANVLFLLCVLCIPSASFFAARGNEYAVSNIPAHLCKDADAVVRKSITRFEVKSKTKAVLTCLEATTVFNSKGRDAGVFVRFYDAFSKIDDVEMKIFNAEGEEVKRLDSDDIKDYSAVSEYSLYDDSRVKAATLYHDSYPYTVELRYTIILRESFNWPGWSSRESLDPVVLSRFEVIPGQEELRYWCNADSVQPVVFQSEGKTMYLWEAQNLEKLSKDAYGDDYEDYATIVKIAPAVFSVEGIEGRMTNWQEFGEWLDKLNRAQDVLPDELKTRVLALTGGVTDTREKIRKLYEFMQDRTRYVSIQLGIGGWKPFDAAYVHERGYGDCKALTNYMIALLKEAGIPAYHAVIRSGDHRYPFIYSFPSNQFNHMIACVPVGKDTVWLECTDSKAAMGGLGSGTENRCALLVTGSGGKVATTPRTRPADNATVRTASIELSAGGGGNALVKTIWKGGQQTRIRHALEDEPPEKRLKWIENYLELPNVKIGTYQFNGIGNRDTMITLAAEAALPRYANITGARIFFTPNFISRQTYVPAEVAKRYSPVRFSQPYLTLDTVVFALPAGYTVEALPSEVNITASFGRFQSKTVRISETRIEYYRLKEITAYEIPAANYAEYRSFIADIAKADRKQVVLIKK